MSYFLLWIRGCDHVVGCTAFVFLTIEQVGCKSNFYLQETSAFFKKRNVSVPVGDIDVEMLSELRLKHPGVTVDNEVVEPSAQQLHNYRGSAFKGTHILLSTNLTLYIFICQI